MTELALEFNRRPAPKVAPLWAKPENQESRPYALSRAATFALVIEFLLLFAIVHFAMRPKPAEIAPMQVTLLDPATDDATDAAPARALGKKPARNAPQAQRSAQQPALIPTPPRLQSTPALSKRAPSTMQSAPSPLAQATAPALRQTAPAPQAAPSVNRPMQASAPPRWGNRAPGAPQPAPPGIVHRHTSQSRPPATRPAAIGQGRHARGWVPPGSGTRRSSLQNVAEATSRARRP